MTCPACGATTGADARFCASCGRALQAVDDERRVVTVLFADLVGFTTLSERLDPELVKNLVDRCFDRLADDVNAFGGQVDKIVGDALVALFGAPVAHEDDAERAVRAALRMQQTLEREAESMGHALRMRIGVNTGEVLVGAMRAAGSVTAMGDVVNTASRLQAAAHPGEVLVGPSTRAATALTIAYEARGPIDAKGREEPVDTWLALSAIVPPGYRARREGVPLVGRQHEVAVLQRAVDLSITNRRAGLVLLLGDVGLGKSRLSDEVASWAADTHRAVVREGRCVPYGEANVWWPIADALRGALGFADGDDRERARAGLVPELRRTLAEGTNDVEVHRIADGLLTLMGYDPPGAVDPAATHRSAARALADYLAAVTARRPLVLTFSDLHFADDVVLGLLDEVFEHVHHRPVVVVATARPTVLDRWSPRAGRHNTLALHLDPLTQASTGELLEVLSGGPVRPEVVSAFYNRSGGNPFYVEELVALLDGQQEAAGRPSGHDGHRGHDGHGGHGPGSPGRGPGRALTRAAAFPETLPDTLRGLVAARLDDLEPGPRSVLQDAAVLGVRGLVEALERMATFLNRSVDVHDALAALVTDELMQLNGARWAFRSDLVREVAYQTITKADRAARHAGIGTYLEQHVATLDPRPVWVVEQLAHHYAEAAALVAEMGAMARADAFPDDLDDRARRWVVEAAERARRDLALPTARRHYQKALELLGPEPAHRPAEAVPLLLDLAALAVALWDLECAQRHVGDAERLAEAVSDPLLAARVLLTRGSVEQRSGRPDAAIATLTAAATAFSDHGDHEGRARALRERAQVEILDGRMEAAERSATGALGEFELLGDRAGQGWAHQNLAWIAFVAGRTSAADDHAQAAVRLFTELDDGHGTAWAWGIMAWIRFQQGRVDDARSLGERTLAQARALADPWAVAVTQLLMASVQLWTGHTADAVALASEVHATFDGLDDPWGRAQAAAVLGRALVMSGQVERGLDLLARTGAAGTAPDGTVDVNGHLSRLARAAVAVQIGQPDLADDAGTELRALADQGSPEATAVLGMLALQTGDVELAAGYLQRDEITPPTANLAACRALLAAVSGRGDVLAQAEVAEGREGVTYLDRGVVAVARALVSARQSRLARDGDGDAAERAAERARSHLAAALATTDATGDALTTAVFRLAAARVADTLGDPSAPAAGAGAEAALHDLGVAAPGWRRLFDLALAPAPVQS
jgi:class 3 adenylate cyclase/tetratricopeptide (TPR) repeat protein